MEDYSYRGQSGSVGEIDGIVVEVWPEPKLDPAATGEAPYRFFPPRAVERSYTDTTSGMARTRTAYYPVESFHFVALGYYDEDEAGAGAIPSTPLVQVTEPRRYVSGDYIDQPGSTLVVASGRAIDDSPGACSR